MEWRDDLKRRINRIKKYSKEEIEAIDLLIESQLVKYDGIKKDAIKHITEIYRRQIDKTLESVDTYINELIEGE